MFYDFICDTCGKTTTVKAPMVGDGSITAHHVEDVHGPMRRVYGTIGDVIQWDSQTYMQRAYDGKEDVGMRLSQVRAIVDAQGRDQARGRRNNHDYGDRPRTRR